MKIKKVLLSILFIMGSLFLLSSCNSSSTSNEEIFLYNWGDYIDPDLVNKFTEETGIKVKIEYFDSNESMYAKIKLGGSNYDIAIPSEYMIQKMLQEDMLEKIDMEKIPDHKNISSKFKNTVYDPNNEYTVPYMWGTVGILYNKTMVSDTVDSWNILWDEKYEKNIFMYDSVRDSLGVSLKRLGFSANSKNETEIIEAKNELSKQRPLVQAYLGDTVKEKMIGGEGALAVVYSGDAMYCMSNNPDLEYAIPKEGSNAWFDAMVILKGSKNKENAEKFIEFMSKPENAAKNSEYIGYTTANEAALEFVPEEMKSNHVYWPTDDEFNRCEFYETLPQDVLKIYEREWTALLANK